MNPKLASSDPHQARNPSSQKSDKDLIFNNREVRKESTNQGQMITWFNSPGNGDMKKLVLERCVTTEDSSYQSLIDLRQVNKIFNGLVEEILSEIIFAQYHPERPLTERFDLLKCDQDAIPACFTINLHKALTLYFHVVKKLDKQAFFDYKDIFEQHLNECFTLWDKAWFRFEINKDQAYYSLNFLSEKNLVLNFNNKQQSYLLSCFFEKCFLSKFPLDCFTDYHDLSSNYI